MKNKYTPDHREEHGRNNEERKVTETPSEDHHAVIEASWDRCREYGLNPSSEPVIERLNQGEVNNLKEEHHFLVETTGNEVLPYYENILSNTQCMILLTDSRGQVLNSWGDRRFLNKQQKAYLDPGSNWVEQVNGTNAIGTAMAQGHAVQVQKDEHFLKANRFMVGSAAPIFNVDHDLLGVLDVSSDTYLPQAHTLGMVKLMSQSVENRLITKIFSSENFLLTFNTNLDNIDSQWAGLIVFNEDGTIISSNRRAELLLGYDLALVNISDIFDYPLREMKNHPESMPVSMLALGRYQMHGVIKRPTEQVIRAVDFRDRPSGKRKKDDDIITLDRFSFGDERVDRCIKQAERIIEKEIPILIHGETGVGKEVFVSALHEHSSRKRYPLVAVNCAAIPSELVESELFGYEKGAFTGASSKGSTGLIRKAHKGTLFLDEIGEMPLKVQARLLRVLQERKVTPLGSTESYPVDVKLISATNRSLRDDVERGLFRQDLYYRVSGLNMEIPPLRDRTDRRELFKEIHRRYLSKGQPEELPTEILNLFQQHPWPGNIRQLVSVLQIALAMADDDPIQAWHLPDDFFADIKKSGANSAANSAPTIPTTGSVDTEPTGKTESSQTISESAPGSSASPPVNATAAQDDTLTVYHQNEGNISRTAKALGISRNTLYKRLRELGIK
ncbi:sigma-54-dependent Fis family transcriptional regulator [Motiliproteus sp. MSK22-1]|uniref:sigma-54-dependent Fis family transcriptional regulator n=1 Tax=Motiliproteus sp. MSK22-1 TaxID=1897630 RepID=UPI0009F8D163|nr:sigma-54-dependent Fis family transcriptional regulator [Motiliproteus sp. MSK22-1]